MVFQTFTKTAVTRNKQNTYSNGVKKAIVIQYLQMRKDPLCNQSKAIRELATAHKVAPGSILSWIKLYGDSLSISPKESNTPEGLKPKAKNLNKKPSKTPKVSTTKVDFESETFLEKVITTLKSFPKINITMSITPTK